MTDIREEFEAWHLAKHGYITRGNEDLGEGAYGQGQCSQRWETWQASRAALRVELPPELNAGDLFEDTPIYNASMIKVILQQAGIEVK
ncbi:hypothetical protein LE197_12945 [Pseudomonas sp. PS1(2021)]|uniref:hypothetical protein n=1 Tax=Pseudomonas sp. PS1(2021) TaxID=2866282 RepID=UPI001CF0CED8|nr:hypothetical protein [Pseudomonas sp. PS1(2021)]UCM30741.1 hypothetical protein LE197_12945 [Pseudomonas sp. PS1(2021)]